MKNRICSSAKDVEIEENLSLDDWVGAKIDASVRTLLTVTPIDSPATPEELNENIAGWEIQCPLRLT